MESKELMIGDWVLSNKDKIQIDLYLYHREWNMQEDFDTIFRLFKPIPLTAEILEKNGWKCKTTGVSTYVRGEIAEDVWMITQQLAGYEHWNIKLSKCVIRETFDLFIQCKYVHELQHALRLCGLSELADNFKV